MGVADRLLLDVANRRRLSADVSRAVLGVERSGSMESKPGVVVTINDPHGELMESNVLTRPAIRDVGTAAAMTLRPIDVLLDGVWYRLEAAARDGDSVDLTFDHRGAVAMTRIDSPIAASRGRATRAQFIRRQVDEVGRKGAAFRLAFWAYEVNRHMPIASSTDLSSRAEPGRDAASTTEAAKAGKGLKLDGVAVNAEQRKNMAIVLGVAAAENAGPKATLALAEACIVESRFKNLTGGDASSVGILQLLDIHLGGSTSTDKGRRDVAYVCKLFLTSGFTPRSQAAGGAIGLARQNPGWTAGHVASVVQSGLDSKESLYGGKSREAQAIIDAYGGVAIASGTGGSYVKPYRFKRAKGENAWANTGKLAAEVNRRRFITVPARGVDLFVYAADEDLLRLRSQATIRPDARYVVGEPSYELDYGKTVRSMSLIVRGEEFDSDFVWGVPVIVEDAGPATGKYLVWDVREVDGSPDVELELRMPERPKLEPASEIIQRADPSDSPITGRSNITTQGGAKGIVDQAFAVARSAGGSSLYVGSALRPGAVTTSGSVSDHSENNANRAARDIGDRDSPNLLTGPPTDDLDRACVAVGAAFGRTYTLGQVVDADTFVWNSFRIQIIWRTPKYGGHMGHIHVGARRA